MVVGGVSSAISGSSGCFSPVAGSLAHRVLDSAWEAAWPTSPTVGCPSANDSPHYQGTGYLPVAHHPSAFDSFQPQAQPHVASAFDSFMNY
jgi:hypothetical protein